MSFFSNAFNSIRNFYGEINSATLTGAIDVIVVEQKDGSFLSSPFHVRFGKLGVLKAREKVVSIEINGESVNIHMKLDDAGTAFFIGEMNGQEVEDEDFPAHLATSPIPEWVGPTDSEQPKPPRAKIKKKRKSRSLRGSRISSRASLNDLESSEIFIMDEVEHDGDCESEESDHEPVNEDEEAEEEEGEVVTAEDEEPHRPFPDSSAKMSDSFLGSRVPEVLQKEEIFDSESLPAAEKDVNYFSDREEPIKEEGKGSSSLQVLSDSEYEMGKKITEPTTSWKWGELPTPQQTPTKKFPDDNGGESISSVSKPIATPAKEEPTKWSIFNYLRSNNKCPVDGVYLDDITSAEMRAMYVGTSTNRRFNLDSDDDESGKGHSLPVSPRSVEVLPETSSTSLPRIILSKCGTEKFSEDAFEEKIVSFDDFVQKNAGFFDDPDLVVKVDDNYFSWIEARSLVMTIMFYQRLPPAHLWPKSRLKDEKRKSSPRTSFEINSIIEAQQEAEELQTIEESPIKEEHLKEQQLNDTKVEESHNIQKIKEKETLVDIKEESASTEVIEEVITTEIKELNNLVENSSLNEDNKTNKSTEEPVKGKGSWWPFYSRSKPVPSPVKSSEEPPKVSGNYSDCSSSSSDIRSTYKGSLHRGKERYKKTLRLSTADVKCLNLRPGCNEAEFSVYTPYQGTKRCRCHIYLWKYTDKIVISDIDGTITKSDVLGHLFPIIGTDWAQSGVTQLFNKIRSNGYHMVYLSARAIGQASITKDYLQSVKQGDLFLPDGPLLLNPTSLINAFHREVIEKKPEEFKIACLRDIQKLFDGQENPFYAGYGNRMNDAYAYRAVGIPITRIFTINYKGELKHELTATFQTSYTCQSSIVDLVFPPIQNDKDTTEVQEFSSSSYWKEPIQDLDFGEF